MKPSEIAVEKLGGNAAMATKEGLQPLMVAVDGLECSSPRTPSPAVWFSASWLTPIAAAQGG
jgi:hypothetical protein